MDMQYWRVTIELESALLTPMHSGTLFGQVCWAYRALRGEPALEEWLRTQEEAPFLVSDAMPFDYFPRPLLAPMARRTGQQLQEIHEAKRLRRVAWMKRSTFEKLRRSMNEGSLLFELREDSSGAGSWLMPARRAHNTINRLSGTTPEAGGLYFVDESWPTGEAGRDRFDVYVGTSLNDVLVRKLFEFVGQWGFGRDASTGKGRWRCAVTKAEPELFGGDGRRRMSLSHGSLTANMTDCRYRLQVHHGKVGGGYGITSSPFKFPLTLLRPGATFQPLAEGPPRWGELLREVHPEKPWIVHQAEHLTVGYTESDNA